MVICPMYELGILVSSLVFEVQSPNGQENWYTTILLNNCGFFMDTIIRDDKLNCFDFFIEYDES